LANSVQNNVHARRKRTGFKTRIIFGLGRVSNYLPLAEDNSTNVQVAMEAPKIPRGLHFRSLCQSKNRLGAIFQALPIVPFTIAATVVARTALTIAGACTASQHRGYSDHHQCGEHLFTKFNTLH
jgi:hypothetical protein